MNKDEFVNFMYAVFDVQPIPAPGNIVVGGSGEAITIKSLFVGRKWTEINQSDLIYENAALGFLTNDAFRYYLPAYMLLLLTDIDKADLVASSVVSQLTLPLEIDQARLLYFIAQKDNTYEKLGEFVLDELRNSTENVASFINRTSQFTYEQGQCINYFLLLLVQLYPTYYDEGEPLVASKRYWFKYDLI